MEKIFYLDMNVAGTLQVQQIPAVASFAGVLVHDAAGRVRSSGRDDLLREAIAEYRFRVGAPLAPPAGATAFVLVEGAQYLLQGKKVALFREGDLQQLNDGEYGYNHRRALDGGIIVRPALAAGERIVIWAFPEPWFEEPAPPVSSNNIFNSIYNNIFD